GYGLVLDCDMFGLVVMLYVFLCLFVVVCVFFFFFQAEDGIRDGHVTGVQTCALPISGPEDVDRAVKAARRAFEKGFWRKMNVSRSEERRVGKECRSRWSPEH